MVPTSSASSSNRAATPAGGSSFRSMARRAGGIEVRSSPDSTMPPLAAIAVAWNVNSSSDRSPVRTTASGSFHQIRPFCQLRLRFWRAVLATRSHARLISFELREPWTAPTDGQIG